MRPVLVKVPGIFVEDRGRVRLVVDQHPIGALFPSTANEPFRIAIRPRSPGRNLDDLHALGGEHRVERLCVFRVPIPDEEPEGARPLTEIRHKVAGPLHVHAAVGCAVTPRICTVRVRTSITKSA
jgi:hypothetical protein